MPSPTSHILHKHALSISLSKSISQNRGFVIKGFRHYSHQEGILHKHLLQITSFIIINTITNKKIPFTLQLTLMHDKMNRSLQAMVLCARESCFNTMLHPMFKFGIKTINKTLLLPVSSGYGLINSMPRFSVAQCQ